jgi:hypothetical protein
VSSFCGCLCVSAFSAPGRVEVLADEVDRGNARLVLPLELHDAFDAELVHPLLEREPELRVVNDQVE